MVVSTTNVFLFQNVVLFSQWFGLVDHGLQHSVGGDLGTTCRHGCIKGTLVKG